MFGEQKKSLLYLHCAIFLCYYGKYKRFNIIFKTFGFHKKIVNLVLNFFIYLVQMGNWLILNLNWLRIVGNISKKIHLTINELYFLFFFTSINEKKGSTFNNCVRLENNFLRLFSRYRNYDQSKLRKMVPLTIKSSDCTF